LAQDVNVKAYKQLCEYMGVGYPAPINQQHPLSGAVMLWVSHHLPFWPLMRFLDNFIVEGEKSFYRFGLAILQCWRLACPHIIKPDLPPLTLRTLPVPIHGLTAPERGSAAAAAGKSPSMAVKPAPVVDELRKSPPTKSSVPTDSSSTSVGGGGASGSSGATSASAVAAAAPPPKLVDLDSPEDLPGRGRSDSLVSYHSDDEDTLKETKKRQPAQDQAPDDFDMLLRSGDFKTAASSQNASTDNMAGVNLPPSVKEAKEVAGDTKPKYPLCDADGICTPAHIAQNIANAEKLVEMAFSFGFSRDDLKKAYQAGHRRAQEGLIGTKFSLAVDELPLSSKKQREQQAMVRIEPVVKDAPGLLPMNTWRAIWKDLPPRFNLKDVKCIFDTAKNGYSLTSFFERCGSTAPTVMVIKTIAGEVFGAFLSYGWDYRLDDEGKGYFGSGETFVFVQSTGAGGEEAKTYCWVGNKEVAEGEAALSVKASSAGRVRSGSFGRARSSSDANLGPPAFFMHASPHRLCVGGGSSGHAIEIDASLKNGRSQPSDTFGSPSFVKSNAAGSFQVAALEVYSFVEHH